MLLLLLRCCGDAAVMVIVTMRCCGVVDVWKGVGLFVQSVIDQVFINGGCH